MVQRHALSVIFLALVSSNVIQAGVIPQGWFQHENIPNFINLLDIPRISEFSNRFASSAATALGGLKSYFGNLHTGLGDLDILPHNGILPHFFNGRIPGFTNPAILNGAVDALVSRVVPNTDYLRPGPFERRLFANYGERGLGGDAASAGAASAASSAA